MTRKTESQHLTQSAQLLLGALKTAGVDLSAEPGTPGKLWRALAAGAREGLTPEFLSEIQARGEMAAEIEAARARFDETGRQNPADLGFLLLGLDLLGVVLPAERAAAAGALARAYMRDAQLLPSGVQAEAALPVQPMRTRLYAGYY